jgi:hypothetical protein
MSEFVVASLGLYFIVPIEDNILDPYFVICHKVPQQGTELAVINSNLRCKLILINWFNIIPDLSLNKTRVNIFSLLFYAFCSVYCNIIIQ